MADNNWLLNDSTPAGLAQEFAAAPPEWDAEYWGPPLLAFNAVASGPTTHAAAVSFAGVGTAAYAARRLLKGAVVDGGVGAFAATSSAIRAAQVADAGVGTLGTAATVRRAALVAFNGVGTFAADATLISNAETHLAAVDFAGVGSATAGASVIRAAQLADIGVVTLGAAASALRAAQLTDTGVGTFAGAPSMLHAGVVAFDGAGTFAAEATLLHTPAILEAVVAFGGEATFDATVVQPSSGTQSGVTPILLIKYHQPGARTHRAAVAWKGEAEFAARATVVRRPRVAHNAAIAFTASSLLTLAGTSVQAILPQPIIRQRVPRDTRAVTPVSIPPVIAESFPSSPVVLEAAVEFEAEAEFSVRAARILAPYEDGPAEDMDLVLIGSAAADLFWRR